MLIALAPWRLKRRWALVMVSSLALIAGIGLWAAQPAAPAALLGAEASTSGETVQVNEGGGVTVAVTRLARDAQGGLAFKVTLDTHSVELDGVDLRELATLRVGDTELRPTGWNAAKGGHHRAGRLSFPLAAADGPIELVIRDVAGVVERSFRWPSP